MVFKPRKVSAACQWSRPMGKRPGREPKRVPSDGRGVFEVRTWVLPPFQGFLQCINLYSSFNGVGRHEKPIKSRFCKNFSFHPKGERQRSENFVYFKACTSQKETKYADRCRCLFRLFLSPSPPKVAVLYPKITVL